MIRTQLYIRYLLGVLMCAIATQAHCIDILNTLSAGYANMSEALGSAMATSYRADTEMIIALPHTDKELVVPLFIGSGDILSPIAEANVTLRSRDTQTTMTPAVPSLMAAINLALQDNMFATSSQFPLVSWLAEQKLSPYKVFTVKTLLLAKDFYTYGDMEYVKREALRLVIRLSLTDTNDTLEQGKPLSSLLPQEIALLIKLACPNMISTIDAFWELLTTPLVNEQTSKAFTGIVLADATEANILHKATQPFTTTFWPTLTTLLEDKGFSSEKSLGKFRLCLKHIAQNPWAQKIYVRQSFQDVTDAYATKHLPQEVRDAIAHVTILPATIIVTVDNETWLGQVTEALSIKQAIALSGKACITALKKYTASRAIHLQKNPTLASSYANAWNACEQKNKLVASFKTTEEGQASAVRLADAFKAIENSPVVAQDNRNEHEIAQLEDTIAKLAATEHKLAQCATELKNKPNPTRFDLAQKLQQNIATLESKIAHIQRERKTHEAQILKLKAQRDLSDTRIDAQVTQDTNEQELENLKSLVLTMKQNGLVIPTHITQRIVELQKNIVAAAQQPACNQPSIHALQQTQQMAAALINEATAIRTKLAQRCAATASLALNDVKRMEFDLVIKPMYEAYSDHLKDEAEALLKKRPWFTNSLCNAVERDTVYNDFSSGSEPFIAIKKALVESLAQIAQRSTILQEYGTTAGNWITWYAPDFAPLFNELVAPANLTLV